MVNRNVVIAIIILIIVILGFYFVSNMTGNVITGSTANQEVVDNEYFRIDEIDDSSEDLNGTQDNSGSG
tara:strand:+ start:887 stop:1093 length:207 start_codon:yes stop_codon:yes gene_type:complete